MPAPMPLGQPSRKLSDLARLPRAGSSRILAYSSQRLGLRAARRSIFSHMNDPIDESASQLSREYARMFGMPPVRDVARFKTPVSSNITAAGLDIDQGVGGQG
jgi:hypothetical protein